MAKIGWAILIWNYLLTVRSDSWEVYAGMLLGASLIAGGHYLARR